MSTKIAVLGTGANGSCVAADLVQAGHDVALIDQWPAHIEAMRADGLRIVMPDREMKVAVDAFHLCDVCTFTEPFDLVLLAMKAYDTRWACELIAPYLKPDGLLIGLQNAMTASTILDVVGPARTIGCVVELSSELFTPGVVQRNTPQARTWFGLGTLGEVDGNRIQAVGEILRAAGRVSLSANVLSAKWMKLVVNTMCLGPLAMLGLPLAEAAKLPGMRELVLRIGAEALEAGQAAGYAIEPIFGLRAEDVQGSNQLLEKLFDKLIADVGPRARDCVLQDHLKGRYSEVDLINGLVVEECRRRDKSAPANAAIVEVTRRIHRRELAPAPTNLKVALGLIDA